MEEMPPYHEGTLNNMLGGIFAGIRESKERGDNEYTCELGDDDNTSLVLRGLIARIEIAGYRVICGRYLGEGEGVAHVLLIRWGVPTEWVEFDKPVPIDRYELEPGVQIRIQYNDGLASNPKAVVEELLVGHINKAGGVCDDCTIFRFANCEVLAERRLANFPTIVVPG